MVEAKVKLTVRLPARLHRALRERAAEYNVSLNQALVDTLANELSPATREETEAERVRRLLKEKGQSREAIAEFETSIRLNPQSPEISRENRMESSQTDTTGATGENSASGRARVVVYNTDALTEDDLPDRCSALSLAKVGWVVQEWLKQAVRK